MFVQILKYCLYYDILSETRGGTLTDELIKGDLIIYEDENDKIEIEAFLYDETIWLLLNKSA